MSYFYNVIENVDVASFDDAVVGSMINSAVFSINPVQDLHGQSAPYPAGASVNLIDNDNLGRAGGYIASDGTIVSSGGSAPYYQHTDTYFPVTANSAFAYSVNKVIADGVGLSVACYDADKTFLSRIGFSSTQSTGRISGTDTFPADTAYICLNFPKNSTEIQVEYGSEATAYAPYSNICPITGWTGASIFDSDRVQLVKGSRAGYNINPNGTMTSSYDFRLYYAPVVQGKKYYIVSHDTANSGNAIIIGFYTAEPSSGTPTTYNNSRSIITVGSAVEAPITGWIAFRSVRTQQGDEACWLTDAYALNWSDYGTIYGGYVDITNGTLVITHANIASYDDEDINEPWLSSIDAFVPGATPTTGAQVVYTLKPPIEISIPAVPIEVLEGVNNIWSDNLTIKELTYRIDNEIFYRRYDYIMNNPGYYLFDGGGIDLSSAVSQSITGAWNRTVTAIKTNKPIFAYNTKYGSGKPLTPVPVFCWYITTTQAVIVGATLHIIVNSDDSCIVQDVATANRSLGAIEKTAAEIPAVEETAAEIPAVEEETSLEEETSNNE